MSLKIDGSNPTYQLYNITDTNTPNTANNDVLLAGTKGTDENTQNGDSPALKKPDTALDPSAQLATFVPPSFGAEILSLITRMNADQRQVTRDQKALQTEAQIANIMEQADVMRDKAVTQLCIGIATGVLNIAQGGVSIGMAAHGVKTESIQSFNSAMGGINTIFGSINQSVGGLYDSKIKNLEAEQERMKAMQDSLDSLEQALKETIQKALSTQDSIQENINQTRAKILG